MSTIKLQRLTIHILKLKWQQVCKFHHIGHIEVIFIYIEIPVATFSDSFIYCPPVDFVMDDFIEHKNKDDAWYSPPFYSHNGGYRMCLGIVANGNGRGKSTHVSFLIHLMADDNDDKLQWPFRGAITYSLLNQQGNHHHVTYTTAFSDGTPDVACARVVSSRRAKMGWGKHAFLAHHKLAYNQHNNTEYLSNNSLHLRIKQVTIYSSHNAHKLPSWYPSSTPSVAEFTISEFSKHKAIGDAWYSAPFYTSPEGYKFSLAVRADGLLGDNGTHVSIGVGMMKGEYDDSLIFPFRGVFTVEIINWQKDTHHIKCTILYTKNRDDDIGDRILLEGYAPVHLYIPDVLPYTSLPYNPTTNTQYLDDDDCMRIRVLKVEIFEHSDTHY